ncbi:NAD(P)-binding protein [Annulohypoxylon maeteangense]|uniref:NAD(P)-binding protein n=1 Tax=Annulohypoxylon maeteangense TaxID=1927788 RepID=UPI0020075511|nr:NAD(P)-binding protein [Annulohypoxylon maeteangense]KAI0880699.1 NAD(P)-binding protein [Annulohypoxylon maeteangense]
MTSGKKAFIVGPGFIGWNVLDLLVKENYVVTGYVRRQAHADQIKASGATDAVLGDLNDKNLITDHAVSHDIIIHTATADHLPSVDAILDAVQQRHEKGLSTIFIHTSGTSVLGDGAKGSYKSDKIYHDSMISEVDSVPDNAPHRQIDLAIVRSRERFSGKAKIAIIIPPLIYGFNPNHGRLTIQIPTLTRYAIKHGYAGYIGAGLAVESNIHVLDLARAYMVLLHHLESTPAGSPDILENPYYFTETTGDKEPSWKDVAALIGAELHKAGHISNPEPQTIPPENYDDLFGSYTAPVIGLNSRSRAVRLRGLGWKPVEKSWAESYAQDELPFILNEESDRHAFNGYKGAVAS